MGTKTVTQLPILRKEDDNCCKITLLFQQTLKLLQNCHPFNRYAAV